MPDSSARYSQDYERSHALLIGIGYEDTAWTKLPNAERDVKALAKTLEGMPWENWNEPRVLAGAQATAANIQRELRLIEEEAGENDRVFIYYAGHGVAVKNSGYLIPHDAKKLSRSPDREKWMYFDRLGNFCKDCVAKHILVMLDCCYSGRILEATREADDFRRKYLTEATRVVIASGRGDEPVPDGPRGQHSFFARAVLDALSNEKDSYVTARGIFEAVSDRLLGRKQQPVIGWSDDKALGRFAFFLEDPAKR